MRTARTIYNPNKTPKRESAPKRPFVYLTRADFPEMDPVRIRLPLSLKELLKEATEILDLKRPAKQIFDKNGQVYTDVSSIEPKSILTISCCDPTPDDTEIPIYKSRLPKQYDHDPITLPIVKQPKSQLLPEDAAYHKAVAASPYTVKENIRNALISLFASLSPEQKAAIPNSQALQKLISETQHYLLEHSLLAQFIGPTSVISQTEIGQQTAQYLMNKLKGIKADDCHFVSTGPTQSGKSTLIGMAASLFFQKLQLSGLSSDYLLFPLNWVLYQIYLDDFQRFYTLFVNSTMNALKAARMDLIPIVDSLNQWFLSLIVIPAFPPMPPVVLHHPSFPSDAFINLGQHLHTVWNSKSGLEEFLHLTACFPSLVANSLGMKNAVYIYDHFDACNFTIEPTPRFSESTVFELAPIIVDAIGNSPFFIASQDDTEFFKLFTIQNFRAIPTERIIPEASSNYAQNTNFNLESGSAPNSNSDQNQKTDTATKEIVVSQPPIMLNIKMCHGCPGYCAMFEKLVGITEKVASAPPVKGQITSLRSVVDRSRKELLKQEICRFCLLIEPTDTIFDTESLNDLMSRTEIEAHIR